MDIVEFSKLIDTILTIKHYPCRRLGGNGKLIPWGVGFDGGWISDGCMKRTVHGSGDTIREAVDDYVNKISGELLIIEEYNKRKEYRVPQLVSVGAW